nr:murein transglycosylase A [Desulfuromonas sp. CSMB_57]
MVEEALAPWGSTVLEKSPALQAVPWTDLENWQRYDPRPALGAFLKSCQSLSRWAAWAGVCAEAKRHEGAGPEEVRRFFEHSFLPHQVTQETGGVHGLVTGYYVPDLKGSKERTPRYRFPIFERPSDLLVVDLAAIYPDLSKYNLRGRVEGKRLVPYWTRDEIDSGMANLPARVLCYVEDPVELFFLHVQGSGRVTLPGGEGLLLERGEMTRHQEVGSRKPPGAQGIPWTAGYSLEVDSRTTPLGAPVFLSTTWPNSTEPLQRLMVAQATGGAIKGAVRADFFWGMGDEAGALAGRMRQVGWMWVLLLKEALSMD